MGHLAVLIVARADRGTRRTVAIVLATITMISYVLAGIALLAGGEWWQPAAIVASVVSLVMLLGYFHPWLSFGVLLDAAIIWAAVANWPSSRPPGMEPAR